MVAKYFRGGGPFQSFMRAAPHSQMIQLRGRFTVSVIVFFINKQYKLIGNVMSISNVT